MDIFLGPALNDCPRLAEPAERAGWGRRIEGRIKMSDHPTRILADLDADMARLVDLICRRFEGDRRNRCQARLEDYLSEAPESVRPALRAELVALERELREMVLPSDLDKTTVNLVTPIPIAQADLILPQIHEEATLPPQGGFKNDWRSSPHDQPTLVGFEAEKPGNPPPDRVRYFGDYEIVREIARGGMGVVYEARQVSLKRKVALKMILSGQLADETDVRRFYAEAESAGNLDHPGIVPVFEVGQHEGQHFFSMGFIAGESLSRRLANGSMDPRAAAELFLKVADAVDFAHKRGVIHRDLKPANLLLDLDGTPRITDFGLAKRIGGDSGLTGSGQIMGTPSYMAPEQVAASKSVTTSADIYGVGATLYEALTGRPPFRGATPMETLMQVLELAPTPPRSLVPGLDRGLELICLKCLEKDPSRRYPTAMDLANDLQRWLNDEPLSVRPPSLLEQSARWLKRNATAAAVVLAIGLIWGMAVGVLAARSLSDASALPMWPETLSNPLGWVRLVMIRSELVWVALVLALVPTLSLGWLIATLTRPRDRRGSLATSAGAGLIAAVVAFIVAGPIASLGAGQKVHPTDDDYLFTQAIIRTSTNTNQFREEVLPSDLE